MTLTNNETAINSLVPNEGVEKKDEADVPFRTKEESDNS